MFVVTGVDYRVRRHVGTFTHTTTTSTPTATTDTEAMHRRTKHVTMHIIIQFPLLRPSLHHRTVLSSAWCGGGLPPSSWNTNIAVLLTMNVNTTVTITAALTVTMTMTLAVTVIVTGIMIVSLIVTVVRAQTICDRLDDTRVDRSARTS